MLVAIANNHYVRHDLIRELKLWRCETLNKYRVRVVYETVSGINNVDYIDTFYDNFESALDDIDITYNLINGE